MSNESQTQIRREAKKSALRGDYAAAAFIIGNGIDEQNRTFDDLLSIQEYLSLSGAWLQANYVADLAFERISTTKQGKRFIELQERLNPPRLTEIVRGRQYGTGMTRHKHLDL